MCFKDHYVPFKYYGMIQWKLSAYMDLYKDLVSFYTNLCVRVHFHDLFSQRKLSVYSLQEGVCFQGEGVCFQGEGVGFYWADGVCFF